MSRGLPLSMEGAKEEVREGATRGECRTTREKDTSDRTGQKPVCDRQEERRAHSGAEQRSVCARQEERRVRESESVCERTGEGSVCRGAGEAKAEGVKAVSSLPFRCPRCGENTRFRSLASLRAHLQLSHTFPSEPVQRSHTHTSSPVQGSHTGHIGPSVHKPPPPNNSLNQWDDCAAPPISPLMATGHAPPISMVTGSAPHVSMVTGPGPPISTATGPTPPVSTVTAATSPPGACGRMDVEFRLRGALQRAEGLLEQRLQSEHTQRRLLLARQQHCRQMTSAAMVIASLRQQLNTSQHLLQQRER